MANNTLVKFSALSSLVLIAILQVGRVSSAISSSTLLSSDISGSHLTYSRRRSVKKAQYGSPCNSTVKCDIHSLLTCEENTCQCLYQDAMTYSAELGTCVSHVNEICGYLETKKVLINCVPNSLCDPHQGVCKCIQGYAEMERTCIKQKNFGEKCHSDSECFTDLSLICFEEICQCDPEQYVPLYENRFENGNLISTTSAKCVALAGLPCTTKTGCVRKASCVKSSAESTGGNVLVSRSPGSPSYDWMHPPGVCQCDPGYEADGNGYCRGKYGVFCDVLANVTCLERFHCLNGICLCKYPDDQAYVEEEGKCVSLLGGPCMPITSSSASSILQNNDQDEYDEVNGTETEVLNASSTASCGKFMECRNGSCVCSDGLEGNTERGCDLAFGQPCTGQTIGKCDKAAGLHCLNGKCSCKDLLKEYDQTAGKCVGKLGSSCKLSEKNSEADSICSRGSECQPLRPQLRVSTHGVCKPKGQKVINRDQNNLNGDDQHELFESID